MPNHIANIIGNKYGKLTVIETAGRDKWGRVLWRCQCDCGNTEITTKSILDQGKKRSCGCLSRSIKDWIHHTHRMSETRLYRIYYSMKTRCCGKHMHNKDYKDRGITICEEWLAPNGFMAFCEWAFSNGYQDNLSLDRKNNNLGYSPENCRWASTIEQQNNRRSNVKLIFKDECHTIAEWGRITKLGDNCIRARLRNGWSIEKALTEPKMKH